MLFESFIKDDNFVMVRKNMLYNMPENTIVICRMNVAGVVARQKGMTLY